MIVELKHEWTNVRSSVAKMIQELHFVNSSNSNRYLPESENSDGPCDYGRGTGGSKTVVPPCSEVVAAGNFWYNSENSCEYGECQEVASRSVSPHVCNQVYISKKLSKLCFLPLA